MAMPSQRCAETRSPISGPTSMPVTSGCNPAISAEMPAGSPCLIDQNTAPR